MTARPTVVFDTSVLFSYVWKPDRPYALLDALFSGRLIAIVCPATLAELREVALRHCDAPQVDAFIEKLTAASRVVSDPQATFSLSNDPDDSVFFNLAIEQAADFLVTYDEAHVLAVREPSHPQHAELMRLAPTLRLVKPVELALELIRVAADDGKTD